MSYAVKEIFYSLQGEGANTGRPAVFCRFSGCNLWSGREEDRDTALCRFCDTDFIGTASPGGGRFSSASTLARAVAATWPSRASTRARPLVICTGGEPLLQLDEPLVAALHGYGFEVAIETNGTRFPPPGIDWVCVSPKARADLVLRSGDELKLIFPQAGAEPEHFERLDFRHFFLQPLDDPARAWNTQLAVRYCLEHPQWRLSLQTHKILGIL
ncbi:MAG TPA: 7-carboxy-7-deazaguanine synthase [Candidatus Tectomicrobia bacterium]|nr:7-carboxy-7-deazaguanine synthase [Candidatus Tectomicrobia bacterium]